MRTTRNVIAALLVALGLFAASTSLSLWWASTLVVRAESNLGSLGFSKSDQSVISQLEGTVPGIAGNAGAQNAIGTALHNPSVDRALATSPGSGSQALDDELSQLDPSLGPVLADHPLSITTGRHDLAGWATDLRNITRYALGVAICLCMAGLILSTRRERTLRRMALWAVWTAGLALLGTWLLPAVVSRTVHHGFAHSAANAVLTADIPMRAVLVPLFAGGVAVYVVTRLLVPILGGAGRSRPAAAWRG